MHSLRAKAEEPSSEPANPPEDKKDDGAPGAADPANATGGDTADLDAGKGDKKPNEKSEPESIPLPAFKERLAKEKRKLEKAEAEAAAAKLNEAKVRSLFEAATAEIERLTEERASGVAFDEKTEELHGLKMQQAVKEQIAKLEAEQRQQLEALRRESQTREIVDQLRSEVASACDEFPLVSPAEVRAALRSNPGADVREVARVKHEERMAYVAKQNTARAAATPTPTTVAKPTGVSRFEPPLSKRGMADAIRAARAAG